jgi:hypothetical protein
MHPVGASCFHTLSDKQRDLTIDQWDAERFGMVCTRAENFSNWKAAILKLCKATKSCSFEEVQQIQAFFDRVEQRIELAKAMR